MQEPLSVGHMIFLLILSVILLYGGIVTFIAVVDWASIYVFGFSPIEFFKTLQ